MADEEPPFKPKDAIGEGLRGALTVGVVGSVFSGIQASLTKQNIGPFGAITRYGRTIAVFSARCPSHAVPPADRCSCPRLRLSPGAQRNVEPARERRLEELGAGRLRFRVNCRLC
jgi:hypothetical protein